MPLSRKATGTLNGVIISCLIILLSASCQSYKRQVVPAKMPGAYPNMTSVAGADVAAKLFEDVNEAREAFGFDIRGAGVIPVQVIFDNKGTHPIEIVPSKTMLIDTENNLWPILDANLTYERIAKKTEFGRVAPGAAKGGVMAGIGGAMLGAAIGIVTGQSVGSAAASGAALGAAIGATAGGVKGYADRDVKAQIRQDLQKRSLENRAITPSEIAHGFIFFPGEAGKVKEMRLTIMEKDTGKSYPLTLRF